MADVNHTEPFEYSSLRDGWDSDSFEDQVARTVIGLFEPLQSFDKVHRRWLPEIAPNDVDLIKKSRIYIAHPARVVLTSEIDRPLDEVYRGVITKALDWVEHRASSDEFSKAYQSYIAVRREPALPRGFVKTGPGTLYSLLDVFAEDGRLYGWRSYFTSKGKQVHPCHLPGSNMPFNTARRSVVSATNFACDKEHTWTISTNESGLTVDVGSTAEEVKSLLYARSLPLTATGRKKPILHLVSAHRRRVKEGIDIDISEFLRGVREVEMGGSLFTVQVPDVVQKRIAAAAA